MEKRMLGRSGLEAGVIGIGVEHLGPERGNMDEVFDLAVSAGLNYVDLIYNDPTDIYAEHWDALTPALRRHRDRLILTAHWGLIPEEPIDHCRSCFDRVLERVGNGHVEIAMLTMVDSETAWRRWAQESLEQLQRYRNSGKVRTIGLSSHYPQIARLAVESGSIDVLMFPVNLYQTEEYAQSRELLQLCARLGVGVVAMKSYYGGRLLLADGRPTGITPVQCLHYSLCQPVATVVPGPRDATQMRQALAYLEATEAEKRYDPLHQQLSERLRGQCVSCRHCLPCPEDIDIPMLIHCLDYVQHYGHGPGHERTNRERYAAMGARGSDCTECGLCMERCPFGVDVIGKMRLAVDVFENARNTEGGVG